MKFEIGKKYFGKFYIWKQETSFDGVVEYNSKKEIILTLSLPANKMRPASPEEARIKSAPNFMLDTTFIHGTLDGGEIVNFYDLSPISTEVGPKNFQELEEVVMTAKLLVKNTVIAPSLSAFTSFNGIICYYNTVYSWEQLKEQFIELAGKKITAYTEPEMLKINLFKYFVKILPVSTESSLTIKIMINSFRVADMEYFHTAREAVLKYFSPILTDKLFLQQQRIVLMADEYELITSGY